MTLAEHLTRSGISLKQKVGFIVESYGDNGAWQAVYACIGSVVTSIPDGARNQEEVKHYDPEHDLLFLWDKGVEVQLSIVKIPDKAVLYRIEPIGFIIESSDKRICIGQSDLFMDSVCGILCALSQ